jgi:hypothetical protein
VDRGSRRISCGANRVRHLLHLLHLMLLLLQLNVRHVCALLAGWRSKQERHLSCRRKQQRLWCLNDVLPMLCCARLTGLRRGRSVHAWQLNLWQCAAVVGTGGGVQQNSRDAQLATWSVRGAPAHRW